MFNPFAGQQAVEGRLACTRRRLLEGVERIRVLMCTVVVDHEVTSDGQDPCANLATAGIKLVDTLDELAKYAGSQIFGIRNISHAAPDKSVNVGVKLAIEAGKRG